MWIPEEKNGPFGFEAPVGVMDLTLSGGQADLIKLFPTINPGSIAVLFDPEGIETFQLQAGIVFGYGSHHQHDLRNSNRLSRVIVCSFCFLCCPMPFYRCK